MDISKSKFRNNSNTRYLKGLFYEMTLEDKSSVVYTLKDEDHLGYPSLKRIYLETNDPTEYIFATKHLDGLEHWEMLCNCSWFKPYVERWRKELDLKIKAEALSRILKEAKTNSKEAFQANRYILEKGWDKHTKGRPSKEDIAKAATEIVTSSSRIEEDYKRLVS